MTTIAALGCEAPSIRLVEAPDAASETSGSCGDGLCTLSESCSSCPADCGACSGAGRDASAPWSLDAGTQPDSSTSSDSDASADAGLPDDSGITADAGTSSDSGPSTDAGPAHDSGTTADAGASSDGGSSADAGLAHDAGSGSWSDGGSPDGSGTRLDAGAATDAGAPFDAGGSACVAPVRLTDVSRPTAVVGSGTPASCTQAALQAAASGGGTIVFDCGPNPATLTLTSPITVTRETVLDGAGLITLSGGGMTRILLLDSWYDQPGPRLTVQRLTFRDGRGPASGDDTAVGGGAIYRDGGSLTVIDCVFQNNHARQVAQDAAGGAIYGFGGGETVIVDSTFTGNSASNGGAVGSLNGHLILVNSTLSQNTATGTGGNPGSGGCGGAVYMDGAEETARFCGVRITGNRAGAIGGGVFRVSNTSDGTLTMDRSTVDANEVTATGSGNAGGLYLQGLQLTVTSSTISRNRAFYNGGLWIHTSHALLTNVTIAENTATGSNGGGLWLSNNPTGTLLNCTIANNHSIGLNQIAGAIFGAGLALKNTLVVGNTAMWVPGCNEEHADEGGNLQWPDDALCTASVTVADPRLGPLGDHGGPTETLVPADDSAARSQGTGCPSTDQRGVARGTRCTSGAVEVP